VLGVGIVAALSLAWQQQATLASYVDTEAVRATFAAATLPAITPDASPRAASIGLSWTAATRSWATPQYRLDWSPSDPGTGASVYSGPDNSAVHAVGSGTVGDKPVSFTAVAAGSTHACGISKGTVYCWGSSTSFALGLGPATTQATVPTAVIGGDLAGKTVTSVAAGTDFTCAVAEGRAYCWGLGTNGQLGLGSQTTQPAPKLVSSLTNVTGISAGTAHACAIAGGKAYCWGQGGSGQIGDGGTTQKETPTAVKTDLGAMVGRTVASISAGGAHTCAVADARAFCWGNNSAGQLGDGTNAQSPLPVAVTTAGVLLGRSVSNIAAGGQHTCAVADSKVFCWGLGTSGQLGNGASSSSSLPTTVASLSGVTLLDSSANQSCAVVASLYCWGTNIGNTPVAYTGSIAGRDLTAVSVGTDFGCVAALGSPAACAGDGSGYRLGNGSIAATTSFADVSLLGPRCPEGSVRVSSSACSLKEGTTYYYRLDYSMGTWSAPASMWTPATTTVRNGLPALQDSSLTTTRAVGVTWDPAPEPGLAYAEYELQRSTSADGTGASTIAVTGSTSWVDQGGMGPKRAFELVSTGGGHSCGIVGGDLYCWGLNDRGQLGTGDTTSRSVPTKVSGLASVSSVSAGGNHTCAVTGDGSTYCWGLNDKGQLGLGTSRTATSYSTPQKLTLNFSDVSAGTSHTCGISATSVYCWGANGTGQLGVGTTNTTANYSPLKVNNASVSQPRSSFTNAGIGSVAAGGSHSCAVVGGAAWCWGSDASGQLGNGGSGSAAQASPVQTGYRTPLTGASQITAGTSHTCVTTTAGGAYCWGDDTFGQLGNGTLLASQPYAQGVTGIASVTDLAAGGSGTCAIAAARAYCWGSNASGQLGNNSARTSSSGVPVAVMTGGALAGAAVTGISAGSSQACAIAASAGYCWGSGTDGRLGNRTTTDSSYPVAVIPDARCDGGSIALGNGLCSLASGTTYYYRVSYSLDGVNRKSGPWRGLTAA
jgi:alpha-tubulin suppressor-like RCC1 family protein